MLDECALIDLVAAELRDRDSAHLDGLLPVGPEKRRFVKGLRVNLDADTPIASLVLKDTGEEASAIHIHDRDNEVAEPLEALLAGQGVAHLLWKEGEPLPARVSRTPRRSWDGQQAA